MSRALVDTGIFVSVLNKETNYEKSAIFLEKVLQKKIEAFISVVTISEILSIYYKINEREATLAKTYIESIFNEDRIVPLIKDMAEIAGKIKALHKLSLGDAIIISTALAMKCDFLVSLDNELKKSGLITIKEPKDVI